MNTCVHIPLCNVDTSYPERDKKDRKLMGEGVLEKAEGCVADEREATQVNLGWRKCRHSQNPRAALDSEMFIRPEANEKRTGGLKEKSLPEL